MQTIDIEKEYIIFTTVAFNVDYKQHLINHLSVPDDYTQIITYKIKYLEKSNIYDLIKNKHPFLKKANCVYIFTNLHQVPNHGYQLLRFCKIIDIIWPNEENASQDDFVQFKVKFSDFVSIIEEKFRKDFEKKFDKFIRSNNYHYQLPKERQKMLNMKTKYEFNTYVFKYEKKSLDSHMDKKPTPSKDSWSNIITYLKKMEHLPEYPMSPIPEIFDDSLFLRWTIHNQKNDKLVKTKKNMFILQSNGSYYMKVESYIPKSMIEEDTNVEFEVVTLEDDKSLNIYNSNIKIPLSQPTSMRKIHFKSKSLKLPTNTTIDFKPFSTNEISSVNISIYTKIKLHILPFLFLALGIASSILIGLVTILVSSDIPLYATILIIIGAFISASISGLSQLYK